MEHVFKIMNVAALALLLTACSSGSVPSDLATASGATTAETSPLTLSAAGVTSMYVNGALQLYVYGGTTPYAFATTGGSVSATYAYAAPSVAGSYLITVTDALGAQADVTVTVVDAATTTTDVTTTTTDTTTDTTTTTGAPAVKVIWRFYNSGSGMHSFSDNQSDGQGGALEGPAYLVLVNAEAGSTPFYRCSLPLGYGLTGFFDTTDPGCEGQAVSAVYLLGYVYTAQNAAGTLQPLYRFRAQFLLGGVVPMLDHLETPANPNLPAAGWALDPGVYAWVPVQ